MNQAECSEIFLFFQNCEILLKSAFNCTLLKTERIEKLAPIEEVNRVRLFSTSFIDESL